MSLRKYTQAGQHVRNAREAMDKLLDAGDGLAAAGIGIPFWPPP
jgi:hypothetical protein